MKRLVYLRKSAPCYLFRTPEMHGELLKRLFLGAGKKLWPDPGRVKKFCQFLNGADRIFILAGHYRPVLVWEHKNPVVIWAVRTGLTHFLSAFWLILEKPDRNFDAVWRISWELVNQVGPKV